MLNYQDFEVIENYTPYDFKLLDPHKKQKSYVVYKSLEDNKLVRVVCTKSLDFLHHIHILEESDLVDGPLGYLKKGTQFFIFMDIHEEITLFDTIQLRKAQIKKPYFNECQTFQLIKVVVSTFDILLEKGFNVQVLTPGDFVIIDSEKENKIKLRFPLQQPIFQQNDCIHQYLRQRMEYCAPEVLDRLFSSRNNSSKSQKSAIYSLGLIILFSVFGEPSTRILRVEPTQNDIEFQNEFKFKRKQIKIFYDSKTIPKVLKMLLEKRERFRDGIKTLKLKLLSPIFSQVSKYDTSSQIKQEEIDDILIEHKTTRSFDYDDSIVPIERKKTIQFQVMVQAGSINTLNNSEMQVSNHETIKQSKLTLNCLSGLDAETINKSYNQNLKIDLIFNRNFRKGMVQTTVNSPGQYLDKSILIEQSLQKNYLFNSHDNLVFNEALPSKRQKQKLKIKKKTQTKFSGRVQEYKKFKLLSYLLFGIVVLLVGLCLLYLSIFSDE